MYDYYEPPHFDADSYLEYMYKEYLEEVDRPLSFEDWLDQYFPSVEEDKQR